MLKVSKIKEILKQNNIKGWAHLNKPGLIELLKEKDLMPVEPPKPERRRQTKEEIDPKNLWRCDTIKNRKTVVLKDIATEEEITFPSLHKAAKFIGKVTSTISYWDGKIWKNKYEIKIKKS